MLPKKRHKEVAKAIKWTDEELTKRIYEVMRALNINHMPSRQEAEAATGNCQLSSAITKHGGYWFWANKLGLPIKRSDSLTGSGAEEKVAQILNEKGFSCERTSVRHPYDILVDGVVKVDVKAAHKTSIRGYEAYAFRLSKAMPTCDFYILCCLDEENEIFKTYYVPSHHVNGQVQICLGKESRKFGEYALPEAEDKMRQFAEAVKAI